MLFTSNHRAYINACKIDVCVPVIKTPKQLFKSCLQTSLNAVVTPEINICTTKIPGSSEGGPFCVFFLYILKGKRNAYSLWLLFVSKVYIINFVNESVFGMLNFHICTHCDTFLCKKTTCVSQVNGKGDRGYVREIHAVLNNRKS